MRMPESRSGQDILGNTGGYLACKGAVSIRLIARPLSGVGKPGNKVQSLYTILLSNLGQKRSSAFVETTADKRGLFCEGVQHAW